MRRSGELIELPDLSKAIKLAEVNLDCCSKLQWVHPSILSLHSLCLVSLRKCEALTSLTSNAHLKSLSLLDLSGCLRLKNFSVTSECSRFSLYLSGTAINDELCSSSRHLSKIDSFLVDRCKNVTSFHKLVELGTLRCLYASFCNKLASNLRFIFDEMHALEILCVNDCSELFELPENINLLPSLRVLDLKRTNIETLPLSIKHLSNLQHLHLEECERLRSLPELPPSIIELSTENCPSIEIIHLPLTNEDREGKEKYWMENCGPPIDTRFTFINCMKLDAQSIKAAEEKLVLEINKALYLGARMEYPGERVPEWFKYRSTQSDITVALSSSPQPWDLWGFILCAVISRSYPVTKIHAMWFVDGQYVYNDDSLGCYGSTLSDHVFLWNDQCSSVTVQTIVEAKRSKAQSSTYHPLLRIEFKVKGRKSLDNEIAAKVKECGVCPIYAPEYKNYIKQIKSALHPHSNSNAMGVATRKRKYHNSDGSEEFDSGFESSDGFERLDPESESSDEFDLF